MPKRPEQPERAIVLGHDAKMTEKRAVLGPVPEASSAVTPLFRRIEEWRLANGRDPKTGRRGKQPGRQRREPDRGQLVVVALRMAAQFTTRDDLRPLYIELASDFARCLQENTAVPLERD